MAQTAVDAARSSLVLNAELPVGAAGIPGTQLTALNAGTMFLLLTSTASTRVGGGDADHQRHRVYDERAGVLQRVCREFGRVERDYAGHCSDVVDVIRVELPDDRQPGDPGPRPDPRVLRELERAADLRRERQHAPGRRRSDLGRRVLMTSLWSNAELLYSMPAAGAAASAPGTASAILTGNSASLPAFKLPALRALWGMDHLPGKSLRIVMRGIFGTPASAPGTWLVGVGLNTTQATKPTATVLAATGAFTPASPNLSLGSTAGMFEMEFDVVVQAVGTNAGATPAASVFTSGAFSFGPGNNAATGQSLDLMVGSGAQVTMDPTVEYWVEGYATFSTGPASTSITAQQFLVSPSTDRVLTGWAVTRGRSV